MDCLKAMVIMFGQINQSIKVILSRDIEMVMGYGLIKKKGSNTKVIISQIESMGMAFLTGKI